MVVIYIEFLQKAYNKAAVCEENPLGCLNQLAATIPVILPAIEIKLYLVDEPVFPKTPQKVLQAGQMVLSLSLPLVLKAYSQMPPNLVVIPQVEEVGPTNAGQGLNQIPQHLIFPVVQVIELCINPPLL